MKIVKEELGISYNVLVRSDIERFRVKSLHDLTGGQLFVVLARTSLGETALHIIRSRACPLKVKPKVTDMPWLQDYWVRSGGYLISGQEFPILYADSGWGVSPITEHTSYLSVCFRYHSKVLRELNALLKEDDVVITAFLSNAVINENDLFYKVDRERNRERTTHRFIKGE